MMLQRGGGGGDGDCDGGDDGGDVENGDDRNTLRVQGCNFTQI